MTKSIFSNEYERLRESLVEARKAARLTQAELGMMLSRPQSYVSKFERGERRLDVVEFLEVAHAVRADPCKLIRRIERRSSGRTRG